MHEVAIAESILHTIRVEAKKRNSKPTVVRISCGTFNAVNEEMLRFAFEAAAKDTICEGVEIVVEKKAIKARCRHCGSESVFDVMSPLCKECSSGDIEILPDAPLVLEEIDFKTE